MSARDRMVRILADALRKPPEDYVGSDLAEAIAQHAVDQLVDKAGGWLIYAGAIRHVEIADRFGPSSWEITTDEHPRDRETWENPNPYE